MNSIVNGIANEYRGRVDVRQLNARSDGSAAFALYRLTGHPAYVVILSNGQITWSDVGIKTREQIIEQLSDALAKQ
jgi:hypothetical protein